MPKLYQEEEEKFNFETEWLDKNSPEYLQKRFDFLKKCLGESVTKIIKAKTLVYTTPATVMKDLIKKMEEAFEDMFRKRH